MAKSDDSLADLDARFVAMYGQTLSDNQLLFFGYYKALWRFKMKSPQIPHFIPSADLGAEERNYRQWEKMICDVFIKAVLAHDRKTIIELADAAEFFKDKLGDDFAPADPERLALLKIKNQPRLFQKRFTIRQIAEQVYDKKLLKHHAADGFSSLRRKCKEIGVPIRPSRKIKGK